MTFDYSPLLPTGPDTTAYRRLDVEPGAVRAVDAAGRTFIDVDQDALEQLAFEGSPGGTTCLPIVTGQ